MRILIIAVVLTLSLNTVSFAQKKPDDKQQSLHLYYKEVMYNKSFSEIFGEALLISIVAGISGLAMGTASHNVGGDFNTGFAVGTMTSLSDQTAEAAILPFTDKHIYAFGRCFVGESLTYATDVKFCDRSFIIEKYEELTSKDVVSQSIKGNPTATFYKYKEHIACRNWALELHKRKLNKCKEYTSPNQMRYLTAVINRIVDEQKSPNKYWDKHDTYRIIDNK